MNVLRIFYALSATSLIALIALCVAWELWLAPLRPGGSWVVLKVLPLLTPLFGILKPRIYTYQWAAMVMLGYFVEGVVRAFSESGRSAALAGLEIALALTFIVSAAAFVRASRRPASTGATPAD